MDGRAGGYPEVGLTGVGFLQFAAVDGRVFNFADDSEILDQPAPSSLYLLDVQRFYEQLFLLIELRPNIGYVAVVAKYVSLVQL